MPAALLPRGGPNGRGTYRSFSIPRPNAARSSIPTAGAVVEDPLSWPGYIMDKNHVHRMDPYHQPGDPVTKFNRDSNCAKG